MSGHELTDISDLDDNDMALLLNKDQEAHREAGAITENITEQNKNIVHNVPHSQPPGYKNNFSVNTRASKHTGTNETPENRLLEEDDWHISDDSDEDLLDLLANKESTNSSANTNFTPKKNPNANLFNITSSYSSVSQNASNCVANIPRNNAIKPNENIFMIGRDSAGQSSSFSNASDQLNNTSGTSAGKHINNSNNISGNLDSTSNENNKKTIDDFADDYDDDEDILDLASKPKSHSTEHAISPSSIHSLNGSNSNNLHADSTSFGYHEPQLFGSGGDYGYEEINLTPTQTINRPYNENTIHTFVYPTNYSVRDYQLTIAKEAVFKNVLATIPTGTGKTFIASVIILNYYRWFCSLADSNQNGKIIFTAPTRPLVAQIIKACLGITGIPYNETAILLDKSRKNRETIWEEKKVFFTTPQVVENDLKRGVLDPKKVVLLVVDEAHRAKGSYAYANVAKFLERFNRSFRILALTATPSADIEGVQEVVNSLSISKIEVRTESSPDVEKYMKTKDVVQMDVPALNDDIVEIIEILSEAILPVLREANEADLYEETDPARINAFIALQKANKVVANPSIPEGLKWKHYFILQLLSHVGQMLRRLKIYGIRCFYRYFMDKYKEFNAKYSIGKSKNKTAATFYQNTRLLQIFTKCDELLEDSNFITHYKFKYMIEELLDFFCNSGADSESSSTNGSKVIIFTELRESALEIVKSIDSLQNKKVRPHIFIGQARGKENFDETEYLLKNKKKGFKKVEKAALEKEKSDYQLEKQMKKKQEKETRIASRTGSSEEAQVSGMNQSQQKQVINDFKTGTFNVLVCTSIGEEGLDIGEVDLIICFDATSSPIKNIQRMGRTGRKRDGKIVLLLSGTEKSKFNRAMETYQDLQNSIVSGNSIVYHSSDRMLPLKIEDFNKGLELVFAKIEISDTNAKVNKMDDPEEVIKFATQAMTGKLDAKKPAKRNKRSKSTGGTKKQKQFHMPEGVTGGIISAIQMLQKRKTSGDRVREEETIPTIENPNDDLVGFTPDTKHGQNAAQEESLTLQNPDGGVSSTAGNTLADIMRNLEENSSDDDADIRHIVDTFVQPKASQQLAKERQADAAALKNEPQSRINTQDYFLEDYFQKHYKPIETSMIINADLNKAHRPIKVEHTRFVRNIFKIFQK